MLLSNYQRHRNGKLQLMESKWDILITLKAEYSYNENVLA